MSETVEEKRERGLRVVAEMMGQEAADGIRQVAQAGGFGVSIAHQALESAFADAWDRGGLQRRERSLVMIGALIAMRELKQLKMHVHIAITNGLTASEIEEALAQASPYVGLPASSNALTAIVEALTEIGEYPTNPKMDDAR